MSEIPTSGEEQKLFTKMIKDSTDLKDEDSHLIYENCKTVQKDAKAKGAAPSFGSKARSWFKAKWTTFTKKTLWGGSQEKLLQAIVSKIKLDPNKAIHTLRWYDDKTIVQLGSRHMLQGLKGARDAEVSISDDVITSAVALAKKNITKLALATLTNKGQNTIFERELQKLQIEFPDHGSTIERFTKLLDTPKEDLTTLRSQIEELQARVQSENKKIQDSPLFEKYSKIPLLQVLLDQRSGHLLALQVLSSTVQEKIIFANRDSTLEGFTRRLNAAEDLPALMAEICTLQEEVKQKNEEIQGNLLFKNGSKSQLLSQGSTQLQELEELRGKVQEKILTSIPNLQKDLESLDLHSLKQKASELAEEHGNEEDVFWNKIINEVLKDTKAQQVLSCAHEYSFEELGQVSKLADVMNYIKLELWLGKREELLGQKEASLKEQQDILEHRAKVQLRMHVPAELSRDIRTYNRKQKLFSREIELHHNQKKCLKEIQLLQQSIKPSLEVYKTLSHKDPNSLTLTEKQELLRCEPKGFVKEILEKQIALLSSNIDFFPEDTQSKALVESILAQKKEELTAHLKVVAAAEKIQSTVPVNQKVSEPLPFSIYNSATHESIVIPIAPDETIKALKEKIAHQLNKRPNEIAILYAGVTLRDKEVMQTLITRGATQENKLQALRWVEVPQELTASQIVQLIQEAPTKVQPAKLEEKAIVQFLENPLMAHLMPYFLKKVTETTENPNRPSLMQDMLTKVKEKFPDSKYTDAKIKQIILESYVKIAARGLNEVYRKDIIEYRKQMYTEQWSGEHAEIFAGEKFSLSEYVDKRAEDNPFILPDDPREFHQDALHVFIDQLKKAIPKDLKMHLTDKGVEKLAKETLREVIREHNKGKKADAE
jgi:hypothetical protein